MRLEPVAIIGIGCRYPSANSPEAFWQLVRDGVDAITEVPKSRWQIDRFYDPDPTQPNKTHTRWGGFLDQIDSFDPQFFGIAPREVSSMDPQQRLLLEVAWEALEDAGQVPEALKGSKTGVFIGIGTHDYSIMLWQNPVNDPYAATGTGNCIAANRLSYIFDFKGPSLAVDTACSSSLVAVHLACQSLWYGESSLALAGGVNVLLLPTVTIGFSKGGFMSAEGRCKSFDASADGYVRSEGAGIVVLKPLSQALADRDPIYAVIRGSAVNQDGFSNGLAAPNPQAQEAVMRETYNRAGVSPAQVQYVEAHGTGTRLGDPIELQALGAVVAENRQPDDYCAIGSVKTNIGHAETAAGVAGLIKVALSLQHKQIPPSLHFKVPNPRVDFDNFQLRVQTKLAPWPIRSSPMLAGVNSFGFGGTNAHVVLEAAPAARKDQDDKKQVERPLHLLTLSAKSEQALQELIQCYKTFLTNLLTPLSADYETVSIADICFTANTRRSHFSHRFVAVVESAEQLQRRLCSFTTEPQITRTPHSFNSDKPASIAFLFTGQGSQYEEMGRQLYDTQPQFRQTLDRCAEILRPHLDKPLLDVIYPQHAAQIQPSEFPQTVPETATQTNLNPPSLLDQTAYTQPALFALEYALAQLWISWGIVPTVVMGHSIGEYVAACIAGVFSLEDGLKLIASRARLMQALPQNGAMISVLADEVSVRSFIAAYPQDLSIAACNGSHSIVVSGQQAAIAAIGSDFEAAGIKTAQLNVSHAFHSPLMEPMLAAFAQVAATITYHSPQIPIISNLTGDLIGDEIATPDYWCQHVRQPVQFAASMKTLHQQGYRTFVEIGPKPTLLGMGRICLQTINLQLDPQLDPQPSTLWLPSLRPTQTDWDSLLQSLSELYLQGIKIDWSGFENESLCHVVHLPTYPFQRQRFWWDAAELPELKGRSPLLAASLNASSNTMQISALHPLLGQRLHLAGTEEIRFQASISQDSPSYLIDHCLLTRPVFPAAGYIEIALAAGNTVLQSSQFQSSQLQPKLELEAFTIEQALILTAGSITLQVLLCPDSDSGYSFQIFSNATPVDCSTPFIRHASGIIRITENTSSGSFPELSILKDAFMQSSLSTADYYQKLRSQGLHYGESFQAIQSLWRRKGEALSLIQLSESLASESTTYQFHPTLLDACFQMLEAAAASGFIPDRQGTYLPVKIDRFFLYFPSGDRLWSHVKIRPDVSFNDSTYPSSIKSDLHLFDETGTVIAKIEGLSLQYVHHSSLRQLLKEKEIKEIGLQENLSPEKGLEETGMREKLQPEKQGSSNWLYEIVWKPQPKSQESSPETTLVNHKPVAQSSAAQLSTGSWLIFVDRLGVGIELARALENRGDRCILISPGQVYTQLEPQHYQINPAQPKAFHRLLTAIAETNLPPCRGVIHLWGLDAPPIEHSPARLQSAQVQGCGSVLHLIQALTQVQKLPLPRLWLVTRGTQKIAAVPSMVTASAIAPSTAQLQQADLWQQAALWGLARVIRLEHPELHCTCLDLDPSDSANEIQALLDELCFPDVEDQIVYRQETRYVARLLPQATSIQSNDRLQIPAADSFRLGISNYGVLDNLTLIPAARRLPNAGEVEIQVGAAGVNFRDVLNALGLLKPYLEQMGFSEAAEIPFGGDCAGRIVAVGDGVSAFQVGDDVIAAQAIGSLSQFVTVNAQFVAPKPKQLTLAEAATLPTTFLTAYYGLCHLAKLKRGDRVLIHAAAGGVGQAAVQLAQQIGAEIFATASPSKWPFLRSIGVQQIMNSRSLDFASEVMHRTQGKGVDVVFNSLNGEFIAKTLDVLTAKGRFVEIGKIGIWDQCQMQQARADIAYFPFDLLKVAQANPALITVMLKKLTQQFRRGKLKPLPHTVFPIEEAAIAFRYMAQARHIGKVVISLPSIAVQQAIVHPDSSYLITGGLGALGLQMAQWFAAQGASHLVLTGRNPASATAKAVIRQLEQARVQVIVIQADVSDPADVTRLLALYQSQSQKKGLKASHFKTSQDGKRKQTKKQKPVNFPRLRGIIHAAGAIDDGVLQALSWERFSQVMAPKAAGAWNLHSATQDQPLDFFICFSSIASVLGSPGQGSYAAANAFMDALVHHRRRLGLPGLSVNWGPWAGAGMAANLDQQHQNRMTAHGLTRIEPEQGTQILETLLRQQAAQVSVLPIDGVTFFEQFLRGQAAPFLAAIAPPTQSTASKSSEFLQQLDQVSGGDRAAFVQAHIRTLLAKVLGFSTPDLVDPDESFADLGMDSLMAVEFSNRLQGSLAQLIPQTLLFDYPTVAALTTHLIETRLAKTRSAETRSAETRSTEIKLTKTLLPEETSDRLPQSSAQPFVSAGKAASNSPLSNPDQPPTIANSQHLPPLPPAFYQFDQMPEYLTLQQDLRQVEQIGNPFFIVQDGVARETTRINGQVLVNYSSYNYLGMSGDPKVSQAAKDAIDRYGTSVSASRVISGERTIHQSLEQAIAALLGTEACIAYVGGHATNVTTISHLFGEGDLILYDGLSHNSIRQGCMLSGATAIEFPHNDWQRLEQFLSQNRYQYRKVLIAIEGIYSTDGDIAPLTEIVALKKRYQTFLLVDEAHSMGVLGSRGQGIREHFGLLSTDVDLWMGTLSKSFASCGGYIAGCEALVSYLKYTAPGFVFSVGMSPGNTAAALAAIQLLSLEPERVMQLHQRAQLFLTLAQDKNLNTGASQDSPIVPVIIGEPFKAVKLARILHNRGIHVQPMVYPSVPHNAARLRFFITCTHTEPQIRSTIATVAEEVSKIQKLS